MSKLGKFAAASVAVLCGLTAFADLMPKAWNGGASGDWGVDANWDPAGVPTADDAVTIGSGTVTIFDAAATAGSLTVASGAKLFFGCVGTDVTKMTPLEAVSNQVISLSVIGDFAVNGQCAIGGQNRAGKVAVSVGENLALGANGKLAVYAGEVAPDPDNVEKYMGDGAQVEIAGGLTTASGAWIYPVSHNETGSGVRWTVGGDVTIAEGSGFNADGLGFRSPLGPGYFFYNGNGDGGSYGGVGGSGIREAGKPRTSGLRYGYQFAPFMPGSSGAEAYSPTKGGNGGGAIRLHVSGDVTLNGTLTADGLVSGNAAKNNNSGCGSGGGIWITCKAFTPGETAKISAVGASRNNGTAGNTGGNFGGGGGGGRVAIVTGGVDDDQLAELYATGECSELLVMTTNINDSAYYEYPNLIDVRGGYAPRADCWGGKGTGAILTNPGDSRPLAVAIEPAISTYEDITLSPSLGMTMLEGSRSATASASAFVVGTDRRERRLFSGFVYSNEVEIVATGDVTPETTVDSADGNALFLVWQFNRLQKLLRTGTVGLGRIENANDWYDVGVTATLTAVPDDGYEFAMWSGEVPIEQTRQNPLELEMDAPRDIKAVFVPTGDGYVGTLSAGANGNWLEASTWGGAGVPGPESDIVIDGKTVTIDLPFAVAVKSITLKNAAKLILYGKGTAVDAIQPCDFSANWRTGLDVSVAGTVSLENTSFLTLGGLSASYRPTLTIGGGLTMSGTAKMAVYAGAITPDGDNPQAYAGDGATVTVSNDIELASGTWIYPISHGVTGGSVRFTVGGDVTIAANAGFNADGRGWNRPYGPGYFPEGANEGAGGWYGGQGGWYRSSSKPGDRTYGFAFAPFWPGSPGELDDDTGNRGGGSIRIHAGGDVTLAGTLTANGQTPKSKHGGGSGGGIWVTCANFTPADGAVVSAKGGDCGGGWAAGGGGGRVAIMTGSPTEEQIDALYATGECDRLMVVTTNINDQAESPYPTLVSVACGSSSGNASAKASDGTGAVLENQGDKAPLTVTISPSAEAVTAPASDPLPGLSTVGGSVTARAITPSFVPGTDSRQRRNCTGYVYSNDLGAELVGTGATCEFEAMSAGEHAIEWKFDDLEYLLRLVGVGGAGTVEGVGDWHDADSVVTLTPVAEEGWVFQCWGGEVPQAQMTDNPLQLTMDRPRNIRAYFMVTGESPAELTAVQSGDWLDLSTWGGEGVPGPNTAVTIDGKTVEINAPINCVAKSIVLSGNASLRLWGAGTAVGSITSLGAEWIDPSFDGVLSLRVAGDVTLSDRAWMSVGGKMSNYHPSLSIGGNLSLAGTATLSAYAGLVATDNLAAYAKGGGWITAGGEVTLASGTWVYPFCHPTNGAAVVFSARRFDIAANAGFKAERAGYAYCNGPGAYYGHIGKTGWTDEGHGASYGGVNARYRSGYPAQPTYGNPYAPFWAGSSGTTPEDGGSPGGGAIILNAMRDITLAGWLDADASATSASSGLGSGGSVWLRCKQLNLDTSTAKITAKGGSNTHGGAGASGGGRICIAEGRPSEELIARVVNLGDRDDCPQVKGWQTVCTNLTDAAVLSAAGLDEGYANVFSVVGGTDDNYQPPWTSHSTPGTAVWLKTNPAGLAIMVR